MAAEEFAAHAYDDVAMTAVAEQAGVSRALLHRYFPSKRDLFAAVYTAAADRLLEVSTIDPDAPLGPQIVAGLEAHIDYFVANRLAVITANRTLAGDPTIQAIISGELDVLRDRVLAAHDLDVDTRHATSTVLWGWLTYVRVVCVEWLVHPTCTRDQLRDSCLGALLGALDPIVDLEMGSVRPRE